VLENIDILIVDPAILLRRALSRMLSAEPGLRVVGEADDLTEAEMVLSQGRPALVLVNLDVAAAGERLLADLVARAPGIRVLGLTSVVDPQAHARLIAAGAAGIVHTRHEPDVLFKAIRKVHAGELWMGRYDMAALVNGIVRHKAADEQEAAKIATLTKREHEIIACIAEGLRNRHVGERLFISEATVRNHVSSILDKLDVSDRLELVLYAFSHGLARSPERSYGGSGRDTAEHRPAKRARGRRRKA